MLLKAYNYIKGSLLIEVEGSYPERFLNICSQNGIAFWNLRYIELGRFTVNIHMGDFFRLHKFASRTKCKARILSRSGAVFTAQRYKSRYALWIGTLVFLVLCYGLTNYVWTFDVTGNNKVSSARILSVLEEEGIYPGVRADKIEPEDLRNHVLIKIDELSWITVTVKGSHATVDVRERKEKPAIIPKNILCDVVAKESGLITMMVARIGNPTVVKGQLVEKGDVLISHIMPIKNSEEVSNVHAMGDVYARIWRSVKTVTPINRLRKHYTGEKTKKYALIFGTKRINILFNSGNPYEECDKIVKRYDLTIGDKVILPLGLLCETFYEYELASVKADEDALKDSLKAKAEDTLYRMAGGSKTINLTAKSDVYSGVLSVTVTQESTEQIGETKKLQ